VSQPGSGGPRYTVHCSRFVLDALRQLQHKATDVGIGSTVLTAIKAIHKHLQEDPLGFGEPLYRLRLFPLQVRVAVVSPLAVDYTVDEQRRLVFIKGIRPLSGHGL